MLVELTAGKFPNEPINKLQSQEFALFMFSLHPDAAQVLTEENLKTFTEAVRAKFKFTGKPDPKIAQVFFHYGENAEKYLTHASSYKASEHLKPVPWSVANIKCTV